MTMTMTMTMSSAGGRPTSSSPHVAVFAFPFGTHAAPLLALTRALASACPAAAFSFLSSGRSLAALGAEVGNIRMYPVSDGSPDPPPPDVVERVGLFLKATPGNFRVGLEAAVAGAGGAAVSCIVSDAFLWMAKDMADEMGVPWVPLWTGSTASLSAHLYTDDLRRTIGAGEQAISEKADELLHFIPGLSTIRVQDLPEGIVFGDLASGFAHLLYGMAKNLPHAAAVALNTFEGLNPSIDADLKNKFKNYVPIGPLNLVSPTAELDDPYGCLSWLDHHGTVEVAYISFGTIMSLQQEELAELAEGLEASGVPFLWSLKDAMKERLPPGFLERTKGRGLVVPWTPQVGVLRHTAVGVFVTHCGWNSVLESVTSGVPMVCLPFFGDQKINASFVSHVWGIGVGLEGGAMTKEAMVGAMKTMLKEEEGKKMRERARQLKEIATKAVEPGESSKENFKNLLKIVCNC